MKSIAILLLCLLALTNALQLKRHLGEWGSVCSTASDCVTNVCCWNYRGDNKYRCGGGVSGCSASEAPAVGGWQGYGAPGGYASKWDKGYYEANKWRYNNGGYYH